MGTTFKVFLTDSLLNEKRSIELTEEDAVQLIKENCSQFLTRPGKIWRGFDDSKSDGYYLSDSLRGNPRKSRGMEESNIYNQWMEFNPEWKDIPKRSRSLICANTKGQAHGYGEAHRVFVYDNAKVAILPVDDIWFLHKGEIHLGGIENFLRRLSTWWGFFIKEDPPDTEDDYEGVRRYLKAVTFDKVETLSFDAIDMAEIEGRHIINPQMVQKEATQLAKDMKTLGVDNMLEFFEKVIVPKGFEVSTGADVTTPEAGRREIMVEGSAILIRWDNLESLYSRYPELG